MIDSHAHEEDVPGTVNLKAAEGDDTAYGQVCTAQRPGIAKTNKPSQALFPVPALDPNDP